MPRKRRKSRIGGIVASPTPTVPISVDSISSIVHVDPSTRASALAAIHPAVPPPTMAMRRMRRSLVASAMKPRLEMHAGADPPSAPADFRSLHLQLEAEEVAPPRVGVRERHILELQVGVL